MRILSLRWKNPSNISSCTPLSFGPFNSTTQLRWKKPANTAQTRLENRTRDPYLDKLTAQYRRLQLILNLYDVVLAKKRGPFVSVQSLSKWVSHAGINTITAGDLLRKYPHIFEDEIESRKDEAKRKDGPKMNRCLEETCSFEAAYAKPFDREAIRMQCS